MRVLRGPAPGRLAGAAVAVGNFDGVHLGHARLIETARERAAASGGESVVLTFDPHPARLLAPELAPPLIQSLRRRLELCEAQGADVAVVWPFTPEFASWPPEAFADRVLRDAIGARDVVVGWDFSFGHRRAGTVETLRALGTAAGFAVQVVPPVTAGDLVVSSSKVREFVLQGRLPGAARLLGRPFEVEGEVVRGDGRGASLGFPTANLRPAQELLPPAGVYAAHAVLDAARHRAAVNVGTLPTFKDDAAPTVEAHLLDFSGDLYGRRVILALIERLRPERRFPSPAALTDQIRADVARVREVLA